MSTPWRKICLLGDDGVGKSSLVRRFAYNVMDARYTPSAGVTVSSKTVVVPRVGIPTAVTLLLWDPAPTAQVEPSVEGFLDDADALLLVCAANIPDSLEGLTRYVELAKCFAPGAILAVVVNKMDLDRPGSPIAHRARALATSLRASLFVASAQNNTNVAEIFRSVASLALNHARDRDGEL